MSTPRVTIVLVRPRVPENLGAVARAMKNFGQKDWALVDTKTLAFTTAERVAVHAEELLDKPRLVASLDEAVGDCQWVVGTSSRKIKGRRALGPPEVAREACRRGSVALVFGDEKAGLTNAEIERCHDLSTIPSDPAQPSLNLAQAVLVYLWELRRAGEQAAAASAPAPPTASDRDLAVLEEALRAAFRRGGFLRGPERHAVRDLFATLRRSRLTPKEARLWIAALKGLRPGDDD